MDPDRFDWLNRRVATWRFSRRQTLQGLGAAGLAGAVFRVRRESAAADCANLVSCRRFTEEDFSPGPAYPLPGGPVGACWDWNTFSCYPCATTTAALAASCNAAYPAECGGKCSAFPN